MVKEALRGYVSLASGLSEITASRARAAARSLVEQGEATAGQVTALAEDLIATSRRNRESLLLLVRHEVEQAVRRLGVGASSDVETLTTRVRELERTVRELRAQAARPGSAGAGATVRSTAAAGSATAGKPLPTTTKRGAKTAAGSSTPGTAAGKKATGTNSGTKGTSKKTAKSAKAATKSAATRSTNAPVPAKTVPAKTATSKGATSRGSTRKAATVSKP